MADPFAHTREWRRSTADGDFLISTSRDRLEHDFINAAFASEDMPWAKSLPRDQLKVLIDNSVFLGVYRTCSQTDVPKEKTSDSPSSPRTPSPTLEDAAHDSPQLEQIAMARLITDHITTAYLTDVYMAPAYRGKGLGKWVVVCCGELLEAHPTLRRGFLVTSSEAAMRLYKRELGFWDIEEERHHLVCMTRRAYSMPGTE